MSTGTAWTTSSEPRDGGHHPGERRSLLRLTEAGTVCLGAAAEFASLRSTFDRQHCVQLPGLLGPELLSFVQHQVELATFEERRYEGFGTELYMQHNLAMSTLVFLANDPGLFEIVRAITGCGPIGRFTGRVYRLEAESAYRDVWHSDAQDHRMVGMSINLSRGIYSGGLLQLRRCSSKDVLYQVANTGPGDALLFRIAEDLLHRVTPVEGTVAKIAFAGWFRSEPQFLARPSIVAGRREAERTRPGES